MGIDSESSGGWGMARGLVVKTLVLIGGALLLKRLTKSTTRWDHARLVARSLSGEKFSRDQASRDPDHYFNFRSLLLFPLISAPFFFSGFFLFFMLKFNM